MPSDHSGSGQSSDLLAQLLSALQILPGVGQRSAQRMALHLLQRERRGGKHLAQVLLEAIERVGHCRECRNLTTESTCRICRNAERDEALLCVVESPADVMALEQAGVYSGRYFVLLGRLSPLDGIGPDALGLDVLTARLASGAVREMIIATNTSVEGEATAHYLQELAQPHGVAISRLAQGVPLGGELEYVDRSTLALSFNNRAPVNR